MIGGEPYNMLKGYKLYNDCTPEEFLNLFMNASFVVTSSFHGTAFAINFGIPFISITDDTFSVDNRQANVVSQVGLKDYGIVHKDTDLKDVHFNLRRIHAPNLEIMRSESKAYLVDSLN